MYGCSCWNFEWTNVRLSHLRLSHHPYIYVKVMVTYIVIYIVSMKMYVCMYVCVYVCMYMYLYIYTWLKAPSWQLPMFCLYQLNWLLVWKQVTHSLKLVHTTYSSKTDVFQLWHWNPEIVMPLLTILTLLYKWLLWILP